MQEARSISIDVDGTLSPSEGARRWCRYSTPFAQDYVLQCAFCSRLFWFWINEIRINQEAIRELSCDTKGSRNPSKGTKLTKLLQLTLLLCSGAWVVLLVSFLSPTEVQHPKWILQQLWGGLSQPQQSDCIPRHRKHRFDLAKSPISLINVFFTTAGSNAFPVWKFLRTTTFKTHFPSARFCQRLAKQLSGFWSASCTKATARCKASAISASLPLSSKFKTSKLDSANAFRKTSDSRCVRKSTSC